MYMYVKRDTGHRKRKQREQERGVGEQEEIHKAKNNKDKINKKEKGEYTCHLAYPSAISPDRLWS